MQRGLLDKIWNFPAAILKLGFKFLTVISGLLGVNAGMGDRKYS